MVTRTSLMPIICQTCRFSAQSGKKVAGKYVVTLDCSQGVPNGGRRVECPTYVREAGADSLADVKRR